MATPSPAQKRLSLAADIEERGVEGDGEGKAGEHEIRGVVEPCSPSHRWSPSAPVTMILTASMGFSPIARITRP